MIAALGVYLAAGVLLAVGVPLLWVLCRFGTALVAGEPARYLRLAIIVLATTLIAPVALGVVQPEGPSAAPVQVWSGAPGLASGAQSPVFTVSANLSPSVSFFALGRRSVGFALGVLAFGIALSLARLGIKARRLARTCRALPLIKRVGGVRLCASDEVTSPFALKIFGPAHIVVPTSLLADHRRLRQVVAHEAHHLRRGDLMVAMALSCLQALYFWNPAVRLWDRVVAFLQELVCDQHVVARCHFDAIDYGRCLLWAAELPSANRYRMLPVSRMASPSGHLLKRRIEMLAAHGTKDTNGKSDKNETRARRWMLPIVAAACFAAVGLSALAVRGAVTDRRITADEAQAMAERIRKNGFPVVVDDLVIEELNKRVATPAGREESKRAFERLPTYREALEKELRSAGLPVELMAVVMVETAFDNTIKGAAGAGLWQFIPVTARKYGLAVSPSVDERMDPSRATFAAAKYLKDLHGIFGNWGLAFAGYTQGRGAVAQAIAKGNTRDASVLVRSGKLLPYTCDVMAAVLLLANPSLVD